MTLAHERWLAYLLMLCLALVHGNYWSAWTNWSECSRTCDGGATYRRRKCIITNPGSNYGCRIGDTFDYATCSNQLCPKDSRDFRAQQCAAYNDTTHNGHFYTWAPYHDSRDPCALTCQANVTNRHIVTVIAPKVLDGTRCDNRTLGMCINGKCWPVGCDHKLGSHLRVDSCGVCGGRDLCKDPSEMTPRYRWVQAQETKCNVRCGVGIAIVKVLCRDSVNRTWISPNYCLPRSRPPSKKRCFMKCLPSWHVGQWQICSRTCAGGETSRQVHCYEQTRDGSHMIRPDSVCKERKPETNKACNTEICPTWHEGAWSLCSVTCGLGFEYREVICRYEANVYCNPSTKPTTRRSCSTNFPCIDPIGDIQEISLGEPKEDVPEIPNIPEVYTNLTEPRFVMSDWSSCDVRCGHGVRRRYVRCNVYLRYLGSVQDLPDEECEGEKPSDSEPCHLKPCDVTITSNTPTNVLTYQWKAVGYTPCSRSCIGGLQENLLDCVDVTNGTIVSVNKCYESPTMPIGQRSCNEFPCPPRWFIEDFAHCSSSCGPGTQKRKVFCQQQVMSGENGTMYLPDFACPSPIPIRSRKCRVRNCPTQWITSLWSKCSRSCGTGLSVRVVYCQEFLKNGENRNVSVDSCYDDVRPPSNQTCNTAACASVKKIVHHHAQFFQLKQIRKIYLTIGGSASILPGTIVVIRCPVRGYHKRRIKWFQNGTELTHKGRIKILKNGKLRIKNTRRRTDAGVYTCRAKELLANLIINFINMFQILQATAVREKMLLTYSNRSSANKTANSDILNTALNWGNPKLLHYITTPWSNCSTTCGSLSVQKRNVSCELINDDYYEVYHRRVCSKAGIGTDTMVTHRKCKNVRCWYWKVGGWPLCDSKKCTINGYYNISRRVQCVDVRSKETVRNKYCRHKLRPSGGREICFTKTCKAKWATSEWSKCTPSCGSSGRRTRRLSCVWSHNDKPAGSYCKDLTRPPVASPCRKETCINDKCVDDSKYCSVVMLLKMCRYANFFQLCCRSCESSTPTT